ncbi:MAG: stage III sporulation protein AB [Clostridia bacterium]
MIKILGSVAVLISSVLMGMTMSQNLKNRVNVLKEIRDGAVHIKNELQYRCAPLEDCFRGRGKFFSKVYKHMQSSGLSPKESVQKTADETEYLTSADIEVMNRYAENIMCEDLKSQIVNIDFLIASLNENIKDSETEFLNKGKLYSYGGVLMGLGFIIILL